MQRSEMRVWRTSGEFVQPGRVPAFRCAAWRATQQLERDRQIENPSRNCQVLVIFVSKKPLAVVPVSV
jgi:hypothetical protein